MNQSQFGGMEGQARSAAWILLGRTSRSAIINFLSTYWMAKLRQMNANLVGAAGFEAASEEGITARL